MSALVEGKKVGVVWRAGAEVRAVFKCAICTVSQGMHEANAAVHGGYPVLQALGEGMLKVHSQ